MPIIYVCIHVISVILMFNFHVCEFWDVHIRFNWFFSCESLVHCHVQIKSFVGLWLTVWNASFLTISFSNSEIRIIHTVLVAFLEEKSREWIGHKWLLLMNWILCPVWHFLILIIIKSVFIIHNISLIPNLSYSYVNHFLREGLNGFFNPDKLILHIFFPFH